MKYERNAIIFKAVCDEKRLRILELLQNGEKCACELIEDTGIAQSALSYHMRILCDSGIVTGRQEGKWIHYRINEDGATLAIQTLKNITTVK
ncbi:ArsR/SmtB family transcription factor [Anaerorhabdus sp.]|uniref:ArsR/SmtB family transcription factor n=1 Tax=Anaerorhabdus sp. TaxID=1872524 RepID=UPI002FC84E83